MEKELKQIVNDIIQVSKEFNISLDEQMSLSAVINGVFSYHLSKDPTKQAVKSVTIKTTGDITVMNTKATQDRS